MTLQLFLQDAVTYDALAIAVHRPWFRHSDHRFGNVCGLHDHEIGRCADFKAVICNAKRPGAVGPYDVYRSRTGEDPALRATSWILMSSPYCSRTAAIVSSDFKPTLASTMAWLRISAEPL